MQIYWLVSIWHESPSKMDPHRSYLKSYKDIEFSWVFRAGRYCLINKASDIFLFTLLLLKPLPSILNSFNDTEGWPNCKYVVTCAISYPYPHALILFRQSFLLFLHGSFLSMSFQDISLSRLSHRCVLILFGLWYLRKIPIFYYCKHAVRDGFQLKTFLTCLFHDFIIFSPFSPL